MAIKVANNNSLSAITSLPTAVSGGAMNLLETQTASSSSTISFTSNIDSTYKEYIFKFINIHPSAESVFSFQADTGTNTNYNQTITSTSFRAFHREDGGESGLGYITAGDQAQGTGFQHLMESPQLGTNNDENLNGTLHIFDPSNTTFVKHFIARTLSQNDDGQPDYVLDGFFAGYFNTTSALTRFQFKFASGNIDSGVIKLYGIS
tara:strand:+ start:50 stop:667 length:618 start_codon:yes stop_codon:yes gene_type:complete